MALLISGVFFFFFFFFGILVGFLSGLFKKPGWVFLGGLNYDNPEPIIWNTRQKTVQMAKYL